MEKPSSASSKEGAWADMLIVSGDPTKDIDVLNDYERNLPVIIKNGRIRNAESVSSARITGGSRREVSPGGSVLRIGR
jgi:hypothetical protein